MKESKFFIKKRIAFICSLFVFIGSLVYPYGYFVLPEASPLPNEAQIEENDKNASGVASYVINLDRSKERYEYIKGPVSDLGFSFERISAIDGKTLSQEYIDSILDKEAYSLLHTKSIPDNGVIGCYLSHVKAWEGFLNSNYEFAVIFEDDVSFDANRLRETIDLLTKDTKYWDIVTFNIMNNGFPLSIHRLPNDQSLAVYLEEVWCTGAYMINRKAAKQLLAKAFPIKMPVDHYFTRGWELDLKFTGIENPRLVDQTFGGSEIGDDRDAVSGEITFIDVAKRKIYKLQVLLIRIWYNLKLYFSSFYK